MPDKNGLEDQYIQKDNKRMKLGYTTGSCAAASAKAAAKMLLGGQTIDTVDLMTPKGILLHLTILEVTRGADFVQCAIRKDSGDDPDVTNGILVYAKVSKRSQDADIMIDGGTGVGRVTRPGLEQPVGNAAINRIPRRMITDAVQDTCDEYDYSGGMNILISIPEGVNVANKTFNPNLGIQGGISVLGTSGIVEPMSEKALIDSIRVEMKMVVAGGARYLLISPGNYGVDFTKEHLSIPDVPIIKCSNYVGETIDMAMELGVKGILFISHIGKFIKVAGGIMNTHSKYADARLEILCANALRAGATNETLQEILQSTTTDEAIGILERTGLTEKTMVHVLEKIEFHLNRRSYHQIPIGAIVFSNQFGYIGQTKNAEELLTCLENYTE